MAGQQDGFTDVLCLHQTVAVPPQLSDEGRYSVLMFFDTASLLFESQEPDERVEGGRRGPVVQPGQGEGVGLDRGGEGNPRERSRRQACHDLSKAMAILLSDGDVDVEGDLVGVKGDCSFVDGRQIGNPISGRNNSLSPPVFDDDTTRRLEGKNAEREARYKDGYGAGGERDPEQRSSISETPPMLGFNREAGDRSRDLQGELDGELLEARLARECGIVNERRRDSFDGRPLSDAPRTHGGGAHREEDGVEEEKRATTRGEEQHQQSVGPTSPSQAAVENDATEYSSGDESSAPPRVDLLLSPYRASTSTRDTVPVEEMQLAGESDCSPNRGSINNGTTLNEPLKATSHIPAAMDSAVTDHGSSHREVENSTTIEGKIWDEQGRNQQNTLSGTMDRGKATATCSAKYDDATQPSTPRSLRLSLDGYEDDFCDDEDESASFAQPEGGGADSIGESRDATAENNNKINDKKNGGNKVEEVEHRSAAIHRGDGDGGVTGGFGYDDDLVADGYASSTSDGVYSGTAAGGLEADLHGGPDGNGETSWGGSLEGVGDEGDVWGIRSPPRSSVGNRRSLSSGNGSSRKVHHNNSDDTHPLVSEETDRRGG